MRQAKSIYTLNNIYLEKYVLVVGKCVCVDKCKKGRKCADGKVGPSAPIQNLNSSNPLLEVSCGSHDTSKFEFRICVCVCVCMCVCVLNSENGFNSKNDFKWFLYKIDEYKFNLSSL